MWEIIQDIFIIISCSVFTVFQKKKKKKTQVNADLYSLPTKQGECQVAPEGFIISSVGET